MNTSLRLFEARVMHPRTYELLDYLDQQRAALRAAFQRIPASSRSLVPATGGWSPAEIIEHLSMVNRRVATVLAVKIAEPRRNGIATETSTAPVPPTIDIQGMSNRSTPKDGIILRLLFTVHATLTVAAGIVLVIAPAAIPLAVGIIVTPPAFLLCYLLAAAELCIGLISWGAKKLTDRHAIRLIATGFIVFHGASALLEIRAFMAGLSSGIWVNVLVRFVAVAVFSYYGLVRPEGAAANTRE
jgi:hypothetical protein